MAARASMAILSPRAAIDDRIHGAAAGVKRSAPRALACRNALSLTTRQKKRMLSHRLN